jgi:hypothetical protein
MARAPKARRVRPTAAQRHRIEMENRRLDAALKSLHFKSFEGFVAKHSTLTLVQMADVLGVSKPLFLSYHARWVRENAKTSPDAEGTTA